MRSIGPATGDAGALVAHDNVPSVVSAPELVVAVEPVAAQAIPAGQTAPRAYTTPGENSPVTNRLSNQQPLAHYVVAHSEQARVFLRVQLRSDPGAVDMD